MANHSSNWTGNITASTRNLPVCGAVEVFNLTVAVLGVLLNGTALILCLIRKSLFSCFTVYLINLCVANLVQTGVTRMTAALMYVVPEFHTDTSCAVYLFSSFISGSAIIHAHVLISANRLWAALHPISYRTKHSTGIALCACAAAWVYVTAAHLPQLILNEKFYRNSFVGRNPCNLNFSKVLVPLTITQALLYTVPEILILATFPIIWRKRRAAKEAFRRRFSARIPAPTGHVRHQAARGSVILGGTDKKTSKSTYKIFFLLMGSMFVCWTPLVGPALVDCFVKYISPGYLRVATFIFSMESLVDPLVFGFVFARMGRSRRRISVT